MSNSVNWVAHIPPMTASLFFESSVVLKSAQYVDIRNIHDVTAEQIISTHYMNSTGIAPQRRLAMRKLLKLYEQIPIPCNTGTVDSADPKQFTASLITKGRPMAKPNRTLMETGTIWKVQVNSDGSSNSKYLERFPDIVKTTTSVQSSQNGPYKSGFF